MSGELKDVSTGGGGDVSATYLAGMPAAAAISNDDLRAALRARAGEPAWLDADAGHVRFVSGSDRDRVRRAFALLRRRGIQARMFSRNSDFQSFEAQRPYAVIANADHDFFRDGTFRVNPSCVLVGMPGPVNTWDEAELDSVRQHVVDTLTACGLPARRSEIGGWVEITTNVGGDA